MPLRARASVATTLLAAVVGLAALWTLAPIFWVVTSSFKGPGQLFTWPPTYLPNPPSLANYAEALVNRPLLTYVGNTLIVAAVSTPLSVGIAALAAFAVARYRFRGRGLLLFATLAVRMLPGLVVALPLFLIFRTLGLVDNKLGLILAYTAFNVPFNLWLLHGFFAEVPKEIEEAAVVDGCSPWMLFWRVMLPLVAPGLVAAAIFSLMLAWNEYSFALILTYTERSQTLPIALAGFVSDRGVNFSAMMAGGTVALIPVLLFSLFMQRYLVQGLTAGAVKG
jgi:multiple sugar transport system permease protein